MPDEPRHDIEHLLRAASNGRNGHHADWRQELIRRSEEKDPVKPIVANSIIALEQAPEWQGILRYNQLRQSIWLSGPAPWNPSRGPGQWTDADDTGATVWLQHHGLYVSNTTAAEAVDQVARNHPFHPVRDYLDSLHWDGTKRVEGWLSLYFGAHPNDYTRHAGAKWLISAVARAYQPGCKADSCLILEAPQGARKSTALSVLGGEWFSDDVSDLESKDAIMQIQPFWIIELSELDSISKSRVSKVKSFITRREDNFRPPYGRRLVCAPRQCVFAGTVNEATYLRDDTGNRRFWPILCGKIRIEELTWDRDQLWAEAVSLYRAHTPWWLDNIDVIKLAQEEQNQRVELDSWYQLIADWVVQPIQHVNEMGRLVQPFTSTAESVTMEDILLHAIKRPSGNWSVVDHKRIAQSLRLLGWERYRSTADGRPWRYRPRNLS